MKSQIPTSQSNQIKRLCVFLCSIGFLVSLMSCGSDDKDTSSGEKLAKEIFSTTSNAISTSDTSIIGLWEKQSTLEDLRLLVSQDSSNQITFAYAKKCKRDNLELFSAVTFLVTDTAKMIGVDSDISDSTLIAGQTCSTQSNIFQNAVYEISYNGTDLNSLSFNSSLTEELKNFTKISLQGSLVPTPNLPRDIAVKSADDLIDFQWIPIANSNYLLGQKWQNDTVRSVVKSNSIQLAVRKKDSQDLLSFEVEKLQPRMKCCDTKPPQNQDKIYDGALYTINEVVFNKKGPKGSWEFLTVLKINNRRFNFKTPIDYEVQ